MTFIELGKCQIMCRGRVNSLTSAVAVSMVHCAFSWLVDAGMTCLFVETFDTPGSTSGKACSSHVTMVHGGLPAIVARPVLHPQHSPANVPRNGIARYFRDLETVGTSGDSALPQTDNQLVVMFRVYGQCRDDCGMTCRGRVYI